MTNTTETISQQTIEMLHNGLDFSEDWEFAEYTDVQYRGDVPGIALSTDEHPWIVMRELTDFAERFKGEQYGDEASLFLLHTPKIIEGYAAPTRYFWAGFSIEG